ncbi:class I SAM-dependent methyltransferase [Streptococcus thermophilus]|nr:methyltransferase domain-containing protein [Streptococcus thermophilus]MCE2109151.1 methyltransferase domain-containing protein [Streptococcus thermophilus]MCE2110788.1 methyltransferase domain-containing protein [Streptococcus thermophilus]MCE2114087.1 methyltransferase domain-containing protein [Streptococcus thermophilus]MCE2116119.1 methyltransferase domain-containing protein [Streptococcus thermophilus]
MLEKQVFSKLLSKAFDVPVMVTYWDGKSENYGDGLPKIHIKLNEKPNMKSLAKMPTFTLAEAYMNRGIEIEGSIQELIASAYRQSGSFLTDQSGFKGTLTKMLHGHDKNESKEDIHSHYDIGNDFYKEWLGPSMTYSAAYWPKDGMTLEEAQMAKVHHILDKLHSEPGKKLLDIGSGWGTLIITAAQEYGLETYGITLSEEQYAFTNQRIQELGLQDKVHVMLRDYRDVDMAFDYITSVGMFEHVGKENLGEYFKDVANYLVPNGRALIHGITGQHYGAGVDPFIQKYIFPGGYIPNIAENVTHIMEAGMQLDDIEPLRRHYQKTLETWTENYHAVYDKTVAERGEAFARAWDLYLQGSAASFESGNIDVIQFLMTKGAAGQGLPMSRAYMTAREN